jgi:hypothetical protein
MQRIKESFVKAFTKKKKKKDELKELAKIAKITTIRKMSKLINVNREAKDEEKVSYTLKLSREDIHRMILKAASFYYQKQD